MKQTLSIITICFNNLPELVTTCRSVDEQSLQPGEHLVIDGSLNNEIEEWLSTQPQPSYRRWVHEKDLGISDAFSKGVYRASGSVTHLLNSGDSYANKETVEKVMARFNADPDLMWLHSRYIQHRGGIDVVSGVRFNKDELWKGMRTVAHPTMFIRKEVYDRHGAYSLDYKIAMDYDMLVRMREEKFEFLDEPLVYFAPGGASNTHFHKGLKEVKRIHQLHIGHSTKQTLWQFRQKFLHWFIQTGLGKAWFRRKNKSNKI